MCGVMMRWECRVCSSESEESINLCRNSAQLNQRPGKEVATKGPSIAPSLFTLLRARLASPWLLVRYRRATTLLL